MHRTDFEAFGAQLESFNAEMKKSFLKSTPNKEIKSRLDALYRMRDALNKVETSLTICAHLSMSIREVLERARETKNFDPKQSDEHLDAYAWPGGYQIYYIDKNDETLCSGCANRELNDFLSSPLDYISHDFLPQATRIAYQGEECICDSYSKKIV